LLSDSANCTVLRAVILTQYSSLPYFSAHVYCCQTALCIRIPLGTEVGLGPGDIVLDGDPVPPTERGTAAPTFGACLLWSNGRSSQQLLSSCAACDYVGIFYSGAILGPVVAYICGGFLLQLYTHFDTIDTSTSVQLCLFFAKKTIKFDKTLAILGFFFSVGQ